MKFKICKKQPIDDLVTIEYIKQEPYVDESGIYTPLENYVPKGCSSNYKCIITKEMFIETYNKWIEDDKNEK